MVIYNNKSETQQVVSSAGNLWRELRELRTYKMSEGTSASAYVLRPFQTLVPRFWNGEIGDRRSKDWSKDWS